jgi:flagellar basal-body rod modification protein FlgD
VSQMSAVSASLAQDQFLQLLVSQLQNQDPLDPVSDKEFISQLSQLSSLQGIQDLNANFSQMLKLQQITNGSSLLGKTVEYAGPNGSIKTGTVSSLAVDGEKFVLSIGQDKIGLDQVSSVRA